jgi:hypothetical protein
MQTWLKPASLWVVRHSCVWRSINARRHWERNRPPGLILELYYYYCCCFVEYEYFFSLGPFDGNSRYWERWVDVASQCLSSIALYASQTRCVHSTEFVLPVRCRVTLHGLDVVVVAWHENLIVFPVSLVSVLTYLLVGLFSCRSWWYSCLLRAQMGALY